MLAKTQRNRIFFKNFANHKMKSILIRNKFDFGHQSNTSRINNEHTLLQNKSEIVNPIRLTSLKGLKKIDKNIHTPKINNRYSNDALFSKRIKNEINILNKTPKNILQKSHKNYNIKDITLLQFKNNSFLSPRNNTYLKIKKFNFSHQFFSPINKDVFSLKKNLKINFPKLNNKNSKTLEKEKSKENIKDNLINLLKKIKQRILPRRKLKFEKEKLPDINKLKKNESCIHKLENLKGNIDFIKTHLDGIYTSTKENHNKYKLNKQFKINEGYIDLEVLSEGENISYKTDLVENKGLIYYIFSKNGNMDTIEGKKHKINKDKIEFKKLLEKFNKNVAFQTLKAKDFENVKKNCETDKVNMDKVYEDLYHIIFHNKYNFLDKKQLSY